MDWLDKLRIADPELAAEFDAAIAVAAQKVADDIDAAVLAEVLAEQKRA